MYWVSLFFLAFAVSVDGFGVGLTYGLRRMKIPFKSILIISICSAISMLIAMGFGSLLQLWISDIVAQRIGGGILIALGGWVLYQMIRNNKEVEKTVSERILLHYEIRSLGVVISILRKPTTADFDDSGTITGIEAIMLGAALSLDAFGAGIGASMVGFPPIETSLLIACMSSLFLLLGLKFGNLTSNIKWMDKLSLLPGCLLIILGFLRM
ncbi:MULTISPECIES: sporulation membrane protein YtaF [Bacillales]|uniref:sporulation membrane protein YtaF n=1 Tax=Bacillales TaxID=1385 RepID=UPI000BF67B61|nr:MULTISPECIES: sporulation membrane protein YtaF [Bacillaceae]MCA0992459.1 sporulation membrane protein YtaF [Pseudalkalibacillus hwajinpoensis]PFG14194.1 putative sporulation protein YtaF [Bacillus sp. es.036]